MHLYRPAARRHAMARLRDWHRTVAGEFWIERGRGRVCAGYGTFEVTSGKRSRGRRNEEASRTRQRVASYNPGRSCTACPGPRNNKGWAHLRAAIALTQCELMSPRNIDARPNCFKLPRLVAAARTRSYKRIRRALINRRYGLRYIRVVNLQPRDPMLLTKVERAADRLSSASIAISTVKGTWLPRCRSIRNSGARYPPERTNCPRSRKRCKPSDNHPAWVPQRPWGFDWQDVLHFADFSSDFDPQRPPPRRRGWLRLCGVGHSLR